MRRWNLIVSAFVVTLCVVGLASAQRPGGGPPGGGLRNDPLALINNESVKKELDISDEQIEKLPDAVQKALAGVLNPKQLKRLEQIQLQQRGAAAMQEAKVVDRLK